MLFWRLGTHEQKPPMQQLVLRLSLWGDPLIMRNWVMNEIGSLLMRREGRHSGQG